MALDLFKTLMPDLKWYIQNKLLLIVNLMKSCHSQMLFLKIGRQEEKFRVYCEAWIIYIVNIDSERACWDVVNASFGHITKDLFHWGTQGIHKLQRGYLGA